MIEADVVLRDAIEQSYTAFAAMPRPQKLVASPLRDADAILGTLTAAPLRELTGEQVGPYSSWAMTTVGDDRDYRHFLPRIFELAVTDPVWLGAEPPVMANRLNMGEWRDWPAEQRTAVLSFFRSAFNAIVERHPNDEVQSAALWFCGLTILGDSPSLTFQRWRASPSANAALQLASFMIDEAKHLRRHGEVRAPFWEDVDVAVRRDVAERMMSDDTRDYLLAATDKVTEEDRFYLLDAALSELGRQD